ncbi:MAG: hypothetical protein K6F50_09985 [Kiritimatiellae bacterium]|nr:hypothetical protein [Kiritimatiellia bacterium]
MTALDYILDGLEAELALERELGVRSFEMDRALLVPEAPPRPETPAQRQSPVRVPPPAPAVDPSDRRPSPRKAAIAFLHDMPLGAAGEMMMGKIVSALKLPEDEAPVVSSGLLPDADVYVVLGARALKKWFPGKSASPGQGFAAESGRPVLVTYTPNYILRFTTVTPALQQIKRDMWTTIKSAARKVSDNAK